MTPVIRGTDMRRRTGFNGWAILTLAAMALAPACTTKKNEAPSLSGPSELGLSLAISATPDVLTKDGVSTSTIVITARNENSQAAGGVGLRVETVVGGALQDYGRLSTKNVTTGSDGRATVVYTAPSGPASGNSQDDESLLTVIVSPAGTNFSNTVSREATIRLVPSGVILPPAGNPVARFSFAPAAPQEGQDISFDASASVDCPSGVTTIEQCLVVGSKNGLSYAWDFGDGTTATGVRTTHRYEQVGSYSVVLTVSNDRGRSDRTSQFVNLTAVLRPTAAFNFSPTNPAVGQSVFFNAAQSAAATGHQIVSYDWTFGDGHEASGITTAHRFGAAGSWAVTLTVTDDLGHFGAATQTVTTGDDPVPTASFVVSPTEPIVGQTVNFDGRLSTAPEGRSLVAWEWNFGDGATAEGERVSHGYTASGTYAIVLTVTDSAGGKSSISLTLEVQ
jgi:PKD repeat protein